MTAPDRSGATVAEDVVVVGYGMAGARIAAELAGHRPGSKITVVGAEPERAYNRIMLSQVLAGKVGEADVALVESADRGVDVRTGHEAVAINPTERVLTVRGPAGEERMGYGHLVLATGSFAVVPPLAGVGRRGELPERVAVFRTLADCRRILAVAEGARSALVLGGGLLGLEAARGLAGRGIEVAVVHPVRHLMERQLDPGASAVLVDTLTRLGVTTHLESAAGEVSTDPDGVTMALTDGRKLRADLLVISCGVRAETTLARTADLRVGRGIVVDDRLRTSDPHISAIGDCAEHRDAVTGLVAPAWEQARVLAEILTGADPDARYHPPPAVTRLKADGIDLAAMGSLDGAGEQLTFADPVRGTYARLAIDADKLAGAVMLGDNPAVGTVIQLFDRGSPVPADRRTLLLGRAFGAPDSPAAPTSPALMPDATTVCQCNTVSKGALVRCWQSGGRTVEELVAKTRATTGCGGCQAAVAGIADWLAATDPDPAPPPNPHSDPRERSSRHARTS